MSVHRPPMNDSERLENLLAALCSPDSDGYEDGEVEADAAAHGVDFVAWESEIRARVLARLDLEHPADRPAMSDFLRGEIDRSVAPYVGIAPPFMLAKLRELAERYWREHPQASRVLRMMEREEEPPALSGNVSYVPEEDDPDAAERARKR